MYDVCTCSLTALLLPSLVWALLPFGSLQHLNKEPGLTGAHRCAAFIPGCSSIYGSCCFFRSSLDSSVRLFALVCTDSCSCTLIPGGPVGVVGLANHFAALATV